MSISKKTYSLLVIFTVLFAFATTVVFGGNAYAILCNDGRDAPKTCYGDGNTSGVAPGSFDSNPGKCRGQCNSIDQDLQIAMNVLSIGVGVVVTLMMVMGGLQYMTSRDNPQAVQAARARIMNAVIAMVSYVFIYAFLQWIVPGGVF